MDSSVEDRGDDAVSRFGETLEGSKGRVVVGGVNLLGED